MGDSVLESFNDNSAPQFSYCSNSQEVEERTPWAAWRQEMDILESRMELRGVTYEQCVAEAGKIKIGSVFKDFKEFDYALDCYCVLNSRTVLRVKTRDYFRVRICRDGARIRDRSKPGKLEKGGCDEANSKNPPGLDEESQSSKIGESSTQMSKQESSGKKHRPNWNSAERFRGSRKHRPAPATEEESRRKELARTKKMRSFSDFTQGRKTGSLDRPVMLPNLKFSLRTSPVKVAAGIQKERRVSKTGACGQIGRVLNSIGLGHRLDDVGEPSVTEPECVPTPCPWRIRCMKSKISGVITISKAVLQHTCQAFDHTWRPVTKRTRWLGPTLADRIVVNPNVPPAQLEEVLRLKYYKNSAYMPMFRTKEMIRDVMHGSASRSFHMFPALLNKIVENDGEAVVEWMSQEGNDVFNRVFVCPSATRGILKYCQKTIGLDACHTKHRKYPCQIMFASVLDGENRAIILAFALVASETTETWTWFCERLRVSIAGIEEPMITFANGNVQVPHDHTGKPIIPDCVFVSDRCKGLLGAVSQVFPRNCHAHCAEHIRVNIRSQFGVEAVEVFNSCLYATSKESFDDILAHYSRASSKGKKAATYIGKIDPVKWARYAFPKPRYGKTTSNLVEVINAAVKKIREEPPLFIVIELWLYIMQTFTERRQEVEKAENSGAINPQKLTKFCEDRQDEHCANAGAYICYESSPASAFIISACGKLQNIVKRGFSNTCTCMELQEMSWPCVHSHVWDREKGVDPLQSIDRIWFWSSLKAIYSNVIPPVIYSNLQLSLGCHPPAPAVKKGRHRVVRIPSGGGGRGNREEEIEIPMDDRAEGELVDDSGDLPPRERDFVQEPDPVVASLQVPVRRSRPERRAPSSRKCSFCKQVGHNISTYVIRKQQAAGIAAEELVPEPDL